MIRFTSAKKAFHLVFGSLSYSSLTFNTEVTTWVSKSQWRNFPSCQAECFWKCLWGINNLSQNACGASTTSVRMPVGHQQPQSECLWGINNLSQNACGASTTSVRMPVGHQQPQSECLWGIINLSQNACGASTTSVRMPVGHQQPQSECLWGINNLSQAMSSSSLQLWMRRKLVQHLSLYLCPLIVVSTPISDRLFLTLYRPCVYLYTSQLSPLSLRYFILGQSLYFSLSL